MDNAVNTTSAASTELLEALHRCELQADFISRAFCEGGVVMYLIAFVGLLVVFLCVERFFALSRLIVNQSKVVRGLFPLVSSGKIKGALDMCSSQNGILA